MMLGINKNILSLYKNPRLRVVLYGALIITISTYLYTQSHFSFDLSKNMSEKEIRALIESSGTWSWFVYTCLVALMVMSPLPSSMLVVIAGYFFNPLIVIALSALGEAIGASGNFFIGRTLGKNIIKKHVPSVNNLIEKYGEYLNRKTILFLSVFPVGTSNITGYLAGMSSLPYLTFVSSWVIGVSVLNFILSFVGYSININKYIFVLAIFIAIVFFVYKIVKKRKIS